MPVFEPSPAYRDAGPYRSGVLLVNSGTPDSLSAAGVRDFLRRLLSDRRTIEVKRAIWNPVLYGAILPTRPARVLPKYRRVWTQAGSPLLLHSQALRDALRARLRDRHRLIGRPVQNVHAQAAQVGEQFERIAGRITAEQQGFDRRRCFHRRHAAAVGRKTYPTAAWSDGGKLVGSGGANVPGAVAAH